MARLRPESTQETQIASRAIGAPTLHEATRACLNPLRAVACSRFPFPSFGRISQFDCVFDGDVQRRLRTSICDFTGERNGNDEFKVFSLSHHSADPGKSTAC